MSRSPTRGVLLTPPLRRRACNLALSVTLRPRGLLLKPLQYSTSAELNLRLRWLAILSGRLRPTLAVSGGVHAALDVVKAVMAGAHAVQVVSALLQKGPSRLKSLHEELARWLEEHKYESLAQMGGA